MEIYHKDALIAKKVKLCESFYSRARGLMFSKIKPILIANKHEFVISIHMFFVFGAIDAVWLNKNLEIVYIRRKLKPFTPLVIPPEQAKYVLELPEGYAHSLKPGDKLDFK